jgi:hypothetical protein
MRWLPHGLPEQRPPARLRKRPGPGGGAGQRGPEQAEERLAQAQLAGTEAERQAARARFQRVQAEQTKKLKEIAARSQAQIQALEQLKAAAR